MGKRASPEERLIAEWIEPNPYRPGNGNVRIRGTGVPVWALVGYLPAVDGEATRMAHDYEIPVEAAKAALAYYDKHRSDIDTRLAENAGVV